METLFLGSGLRIIGAIYNSPTVVFTLKPVTQLDQFKGLKIRTFASPMQVKPMELLGATPCAGDQPAPCPTLRRALPTSQPDASHA